MRLLMVRGPDAADFLQRVTAGPVHPLEPGQGAGGALLNGQSRMIAQFDLLRLGPAEFLLAAPESCAEALRAGLEALHFAENLELETLSFAVGLYPVSRPQGRARIFPVEGRSPALVWRASVPGYACMTAPLSAALPTGFDFDRIAALVPWPPSDWDANTPALEAGVLPWIDREKGCYPGQEVVERSLNVGHPARVLLACEREGAAPAPGERLAFAGGGEAAVLSVAEQGGRARALVRAPWKERAGAPAGWHLLASGAPPEATRPSLS